MSKLFMAKKRISLFSAILLSTTCMIGSGWLFSAQLTAKIAGNYAFLAWILAAFFMILIALSFSKVIEAFPVRGATTRSSSLSHNNVFGMPFAFANWFGVMVVIAAEAQATTQYLSGAIQSDMLMVHGQMTFVGKLLAFSILFLYLIINFYGIKLLSKVNNIVTVFKIFTPLFIIIMFCCAAFDNQVNNFNLFASDNQGISSAFTAVVAAGLIYCFNGFQVAGAFCSEIDKPRRNVPLAMCLSIVIVLVIYMGLQYGFMAAIPNHVLVEIGGWEGLNFSSPLLHLSMLLGFNFLAMVLLADSVVSPSGTGYTYLGSSTRMLTAMAKEKQFPKWIAKINPKYNFSRRSMMVNFGLSALFLYFSESWSILMLLVTGYHIIGYMAAPISMGAISSKNSLFGCIVFIVVACLLHALPSKEYFLVVFSLSILLIIYGFLQYKIGIDNILLFTLPFNLYLWLIYFFNTIPFIIIASIIFYCFVTHARYVQMCKDYK